MRQKFSAQRLIIVGTLQGDYFVVCVLEPHEFSEGKIVPGSAFAEFRVSNW
jgi:DNA-directed RNA polymerase subunit E'/Rpb7